MARIKIEETESIKLSKQIKDILNPDFVYIPYNKIDKLNVKTNSIVIKGSIIFKENNLNFYSPISGIVIGSCKVLADNKVKESIVIENDFKEKSIKHKIDKKKKYTKEELFNKLKELNINVNLKGEYLLVNGMDYEPYEHSLSYITKNYPDIILNTIDELINILSINKCYLTIKNDDAENAQMLINQIGTYPNINLRLIDNYYPCANKMVQMDNLKLDSSKTIFLNVEDIYNIYNAIKKEEPQYEKFLTLTGNLLNKARVVKVKLGTRLLDIIGDSKLDNIKYHMIINGLLSGYEINNKNAVVTPNIRSIFVMKDKPYEAQKCINCGICHINCPVSADPRTGYKMEKCLKCGLCNYLCPSKIQLVGDKDE